MIACQNKSSLSKDGVSEEKDHKKHLKWSKEENRLYVRFLENNLEQLQNGRSRRTKFFFKKMAQMLGNCRDNEQCRSHHQKMMKHYGSVAKVIFHLSQQEAQPIGARKVLGEIRCNQRQGEIHEILITDQNKEFLLKKLPIDIISYNYNESINPTPVFPSPNSSFHIHSKQESPYAFMTESLKTPKIEF